MTMMCLMTMAKNFIEFFLKEPGALVAVSQSNRTLAQARQAVKDAEKVPKRSSTASQHDAERKGFLRRGSRLSRSEKPKWKKGGQCERQERLWRWQRLWRGVHDNDIHKRRPCPDVNSSVTMDESSGCGVEYSDEYSPCDVRPV